MAFVLSMISSFPILAGIVTDLLAILLFPLPNLNLFKQPSSTTFSEYISVRVFCESYCIYNRLLDTDLCYLYNFLNWLRFNIYACRNPGAGGNIKYCFQLLFHILVRTTVAVINCCFSLDILAFFKTLYQHNCRQFHLKIINLII